MHHVDLLQDLAVVMIVAGVVTILFHRLRQPVVLGYLIAGVIIGPHTPPFPLIKHEETVNALSELGLVFLMFSLGLEFSLRKLKAVGATALIAALFEIVTMVWIGYSLGRAFDWGRMDSLFLGSMLAISSTTIIIKALADLGLKKEPFAGLIFGILIVEDVLAIAMIGLLSGVATTGTVEPGPLALSLAKLVAFFATVLVVGLLLVPRLLAYVGRFKSNEMLLVTVLGLCFAVSLFAVKAELSVALGAFLIGAVIAETRELGRIEHLMEPIRDMFSAVFFVAIGMLIEPRLLLEHALPIVLITAAVIAGKVLSCTFGTVAAGHRISTALPVGMGLAQIGEFSFIIASLGLTLHVTSDFLYPIGVTVSALTTLATPYLIRLSPAAARAFERAAPSKLSATLEVYAAWVTRIRHSEQPSAVRAQLRRHVRLLIIDAALIAGLFFGMAYVAAQELDWPLVPPAWLGGTHALLWLGAILLGLPMFVDAVRRLRRASVLIAESGIPEAPGRRALLPIRALVSSTLFGAGLAAMLIFSLLLSSTLLPSLASALILFGFAALLAYLFRERITGVYARAATALEETLAEKPPEEAAPALPHPMLKQAQLESIVLPAQATAARKLIRELAIRTRSGASVVGIERGDTSLVNPGADEELQPGDVVVLLGSTEQLAAARALLTTAPG